MKDGGAELAKVKLKYYDKNFRGVLATCDITKGETVLFVPFN